VGDLVERVRRSVGRPMLVDGKEVVSGTSIGVACSRATAARSTR
jgi:hypothetical protein